MLPLSCAATAPPPPFDATLLLTQAAERRRGGIVLMSSLVGFQRVPSTANYAATKAYVQSLAEGLHHELKPLGVDVLASAPGPVHSGFADRANMKWGMALRPQTLAAASLSALSRRSTVRPGWLSKALEWSLKPFPRWGRVRMMGVVMGGNDTVARSSQETCLLNARSDENWSFIFRIRLGDQQTAHAGLPDPNTLQEQF